MKIKGRAAGYGPADLAAVIPDVLTEPRDLAVARAES